jgi:hypothetical protein
MGQRPLQTRLISCRPRHPLPPLPAGAPRRGRPRPAPDSSVSGPFTSSSLPSPPHRGRKPPAKQNCRGCRSSRPPHSSQKMAKSIIPFIAIVGPPRQMMTCDAPQPHHQLPLPCRPSSMSSPAAGTAISLAHVPARSRAYPGKHVRPAVAPSSGGSCRRRRMLPHPDHSASDLCHRYFPSSCVSTRWLWEAVGFCQLRNQCLLEVPPQAVSHNWCLLSHYQARNVVELHLQSSLKSERKADICLKTSLTRFGPVLTAWTFAAISGAADTLRSC